MIEPAERATALYGHAVARFALNQYMGFVICSVKHTAGDEIDASLNRSQSVTASVEQPRLTSTGRR